MEYLKRDVDIELDALLPFAPALALDGPRGVGKTRTATRRADAVFSLDSKQQRAVLQADFALSSLPSGTVLFDEWQRLP